MVPGPGDRLAGVTILREDLSSKEQRGYVARGRSMYNYKSSEVGGLRRRWGATLPIRRRGPGLSVLLRVCPQRLNVLYNFMKIQSLNSKNRSFILLLGEKFG